MTQSRDLRSHRPARGALAAVLAGLCLHAGLSFGVDLANPRLSQPIAAATAAHSITDLQQSLSALERSMAKTQQQQRDRQGAALSSALSRLAKRPVPSTAQPAPRLSDSGLDAAGVISGNALSTLASQLVTVQQAFPGTAPVHGTSDVNDLRRAMRRFDVVTDTIVSETFSAVLLGLTDTMPTLSDSFMPRTRVAKQDLRERVVDSRLANANQQPALPLLSGTHPSLGGDNRMLASEETDDTTLAGVASLPEDGELAGIGGEIGDIALGDASAIPDRAWDDYKTDDAQYAMTDEALLDEIDIDELGSGTIASLDAPVAAGDLQDTRAGFMLPNGVRIDFAVTRLTSVDGLDSLKTIANLPAEIDSRALSQISGGSFTNTQVLSPNGGSMFTLVQNDLNNQRIVDVTTIDIGIKNLGVRASDFIPRSVIPFNPQPIELNR